MFPQTRHLALSAFALILSLTIHAQTNPDLQDIEKEWVPTPLATNTKIYMKSVQSLKDNHELSTVCQKSPDNFVELVPDNNPNDLTAMQMMINTSNNFYLLDPRSETRGACSHLTLLGSYEKSLENSIPEILLYKKLNSKFRQKMEIFVEGRKDEQDKLDDFLVLDIGDVYQEYLTATFQNPLEKYQERIEEKSTTKPIKTKRKFHHLRKLDYILTHGCNYFVEVKETILESLINNFKAQEVRVNSIPLANRKRLMKPHVLIYPHSSKDKSTYASNANSVYHKTTIKDLHKTVVNCPYNLWAIHHRLNNRAYSSDEIIQHARIESINLVLAHQYAYLYYIRDINLGKKITNQHTDSIRRITKPYKLKKKQSELLAHVTHLIQEIVLSEIDEETFDQIYPQLRSVVEMIIINETTKSWNNKLVEEVADYIFGIRSDKDSSI